ncbi:uncharacterized protein LOC142355543 isoform X2 [Convolutriloba macropyga]|uniref:uncharacterized protein LOC142355543 isoform X2 n=1 Tax=Convolutriloba macropyga TaxID=536237 RepID=UPI003F51C70D
MPAQRNNGTKTDHVYSDDSFDEDSYQSDNEARNAGRGKKRKNSQLSFLPSQFKDEALQQWCHEQITKRKSLQNKLGESTKRCEELLEENRDLRKQVRLSEKSLQKIEKDQKNVPFMLREHSADVRRLKRNVDEEQKSKEDLERRNKKMSDELLRMRDENRELKKVINDRDLQKKQLDVRMFEESQSKLADAEKRNEENERMVDLLQKNHKSESHRLNQKMRGLQLEKDDLEKAIQDLDLKLQEKDKELAIHYIYAQRLTKPPSRLVNTPPKGILVNKHTMTDADTVLQKLTDENLLLQQEVNHLRNQLHTYGASAEYLDQEREKLERDQRERAEKERQFKEEMEQARKEAEEESKRRREELEAEVEKERREKEEADENRRQEERAQLEKERAEWESTQRKKIEEGKRRRQERREAEEEQIPPQHKAEEEDWFLQLIAKKGPPPPTTTTTTTNTLLSHVTGASDGKQQLRHSQEQLPKTSALEQTTQNNHSHRRQSEVNQGQEEALRLRQKELEREEEEKKVQLLQRLKSIENQNRTISPFATSSIGPNRPSNPFNNQEHPSLAGVGAYSRQNSKSAVSNYKFLYSDDSNVQSTSKSNSDTQSQRPEFSRDDTEAQLNRILGGGSRERRRMTKQGNVNSNFDFQKDLISSTGRSSNNKHYRKTPASFDRERSDRSLKSVPDLTSKLGNARTTARYDDIEELLL